MSPDLTLIHYTSNYLDEHNPVFAAIVRNQIVKSADEYPIISVSQKPMNFGNVNICVGDIGRSHLNIYKAILIGAKAAQTEFVGCAEDDVLYDYSHWRTHRPPSYRFAYNLNRWGVNTWSMPLYGYRARIVVNQLLAPRDLLVEAFEERFAKYPDPDKTPLSQFAEPGRFEKQLGVKPREFECYASPIPSVVFSHEHAFGYLSRGQRKSIGEFPREELPHWGSAKDMQSLWAAGLTVPDLAAASRAEPLHS